MDVLGPLWPTRQVILTLRESNGFILAMSGVIAATPMTGMGGILGRQGRAGCSGGGACKEASTLPVAGTAPKFPPEADRGDCFFSKPRGTRKI